MKKILIIIILLIFTSCLGTKKISEKTTDTKQIEKLEIKNDSSKVETVNKAINDEATFIIPESNTGDDNIDERVNEGIANILRSINFQKTSGDNSYKLYYDEQLKALRAEFEIGETKDSEITTNKSEKSENTFEQTIIENTKTVLKLIPWYLWIFAIYLVRKHIINIIAAFIPGVREIKTVKDLLNPPNKK